MAGVLPGNWAQHYLTDDLAGYVDQDGTDTTGICDDCDARIRTVVQQDGDVCYACRVSGQ